MRTAGCLAAAALAACLLCVSAPARAGILANDSSFGMSGWHGTVQFVSDNDKLAVDADYCVYAPGQFNLRFPGQDPTNGLKYIYAYQLFNTIDPPLDASPDYIKYFSVGLNHDVASAADVGYVAGDVSPLTNLLYTDSNTRWNFYNGSNPLRGVQYGQVSTVLIFSSPNGPTWDNGTVSGATSKTLLSSLPSPVPEPATTTVILLSCFACFRRRNS